MDISGFSVVGLGKKRASSGSGRSASGERKISSASSSSGRSARGASRSSGGRRTGGAVGSGRSGSIKRGSSGIKGSSAGGGGGGGRGGARADRGVQRDRFEEKMSDAGAAASSSPSLHSQPKRKTSRHTVDENGRYVQMRSGSDNCEDYVDPKTAPKPRAVPTGVSRPKYWSQQAEEGWRLQFCGWRDIYEYEAVYGEPTRWDHNGFIRRLQCKANGYYTYWKAEREVGFEGMERSGLRAGERAGEPMT